MPKLDGRAGRASVVVGGSFNLEGLYDYLCDQLPKYSVPVFIRLSPEIEKTGTFKYKKNDLATEGFDPNKVADPLYFASNENENYVQLDDGLFNKINNQEVRI